MFYEIPAPSCSTNDPLAQWAAASHRWKPNVVSTPTPLQNRTIPFIQNTSPHWRSPHRQPFIHKRYRCSFTQVALEQQKTELGEIVLVVHAKYISISGLTMTKMTFAVLTAARNMLAQYTDQ